MREAGSRNSSESTTAADIHEPSFVFTAARAAAIRVVTAAAIRVWESSESASSESLNR